MNYSKYPEINGVEPKLLNEPMDESLLNDPEIDEIVKMRGIYEIIEDKLYVTIKPDYSEVNTKEDLINKSNISWVVYYGTTMRCNQGRLGDFENIEDAIDNINNRLESGDFI